MSREIPYIGFSNSTLAKLPEVKAGDEITCPHCHGKHRLEPMKDETGKGSELVLIFRCGAGTFLGAAAGRLVAGREADAYGTIPGGNT